jgi:Protein of unknown function (DUF2723)
LPSTVVAGGISTVVLLALYLGTAAPDLTFWDAAELTTAAYTLGIPHPPGTPLWVLLGHLAGKAFQSVGPARAVTLLSVLASALAGGLGAMMATRWMGARGAVAAAVSTGAMMSIWSNATEAEVYAVALLFSVALLVAGERAGRPQVSDDERARWRAIIALISAFAIPLHLSVLVALPAALTLAWRGRWPTPRELAALGAIAALGVSAVAILPLLSARAPALDSGHPVSMGALVDVLRRTQYDVAGLWPRRAPLWLQIGNVLEWADWQVAYGLHPDPRPSWTRTSLTVAWGWLAMLGLRSLWRHEARVGRAMTVLLLSGTVGVAVWLNMRLGPSYGAGVVSPDAVHEARERDYFFVLGFWGWGLCAGAGMAAMAREFAKRLPSRATMVFSSLPFALAAVPLVANRPVMDRTREPAATLPRTVARLLLESVPANGVLYTAGDNDSFPLWYLQHVEQVRPDVLVITVPLLGAAWYREELARRHHVLPTSAAQRWTGLGPTLRATAAAARDARRPIRVSVLLAAGDRRQIEPDSGWALEGMVYAPSAKLAAGQVGLAPTVLRRARDLVPSSALRELPSDLDPAYLQMQALLRCTQVERVADPLLVGTCNGS